MGSLFANLYDFVMGPFEKRKFKRIRIELLNVATGHVLELGSGTGVNFPLYRNAEMVTAVEPSEEMINRSHSRMNETNIPINVVMASAEQLPFTDHSFDTVVATLVFCTIPHPDAAMNEIKRVCKPGGNILMFEHVRMENRFFLTIQKWLNPSWKRICGGCCLDRDTLGLINDHGLSVSRVDSYYNGLFVTVMATNGVKQIE